LRTTVLLARFRRRAAPRGASVTGPSRGVCGGMGRVDLDGRPTALFARPLPA